MLKVELHTHTADDPADRIPYSTTELIDRAAALGYDAVAVTLHDRQLDIAPWEAHARRRGIVLIPGIERTIDGRHVLLVNFSRAAEDVRTFADLAALKRAEPGLVIAPHACFPGPTCLGESLLDRYAELFDAIEYNAMFTRGANFNRAAERWARRRAKPMVGNGDVHRLIQLGTTFSLVDAPPDPGAICAAIRSGRVTVHAEPISWVAAGWVMSQLLAADLRDLIAPAVRPAQLPGTTSQPAT